MKKRLLPLISILLVIILALNFSACARRVTYEELSNSAKEITVGERNKETKTLLSEYYRLEDRYRGSYSYKNYNYTALNITFTNDESLKFKEYPEDYFSDILPGSVFKESTNYPTSASEAKQLAEQLKADPDNSKIKEKLLSYHCCGNLYLSTDTKKAAIDAVELIETRDNILKVTIPISSDYSYWNTTDASIESRCFESINYSALDSYTQRHEILVGVIDSGVDSSHPDLAGKVDLEKSRDFTKSIPTSGAQTDDVGHGTHVAGIIVAGSHNTSNAHGMSKTAKIVSLKVDNNGAPDLELTVKAIEYATEIGLDIINISAGVLLGLDETDPRLSIELENSIRNAIQNFPGIIICAAGNSNENLDDPKLNLIPGGIESPNIITVGNSENDDKKALDSSYGKETVDIFAPGKQILSCYPTTKCKRLFCSEDGHSSYGYHYMSGTSMAAPCVTGLVAAMLSIHNTMTTEEIRSAVLHSARIVYEDGKNIFGDLCQAGGIIDAGKLIANSTHSFTPYEERISGLHYRSCTGCNYSESAPHTSHVDSITPRQHTIICYECHKSTTSPHVWNAAKSKCTVCGYKDDTLYPLPRSIIKDAKLHMKE